jgi:hypothetical protein
MAPVNRRQFLADVGRGVLAASVGSGLAVDLGFHGAAFADEKAGALCFGRLEPLVAMLQETPIDKLLPALAGKLREGTSLRDLTAAGALANARTFGGEDYVGFHTLMALSPAYRMAEEMPETSKPLPVFKVLYRNTNRIGEKGGRSAEVLHPVAVEGGSKPENGGERLRDAVRARDMEGAERLFASLSAGAKDGGFNDLLHAVDDVTEVHRVVLPYRAWDLLDLVGMENAHTLLRQSVRYCVKSENDNLPDRYKTPRTLLPKLLDQYGLLGREPGKKAADDEWVLRMSRTIFESSAESAAEAVAAALADGMDPDAVGQAISLAANQLVLRDRGRRENEAKPEKPTGSVHGDSIGVHACDSANAWRSMARVSNHRNACACLILGAFQVAFDRVARGGDFLAWEPHPLRENLEQVRETARDAILREADAAIRSNDQARASALVHRAGESGLDSRSVFDLLLRYATSEDGALHAEKYYRTVVEEYRSTRPAFRWRQLCALARVTASEYGRIAPGYEEARTLLSLGESRAL